MTPAQSTFADRVPSPRADGEQAPMRESSPERMGADLSFGPYSVRNGVLFHGERMFHADPFVMLAIHERDALAGDYWSAEAMRHFNALYDAMKAAGLIEQELAA